MIKEIIGNATLYCGDSNEILSEIKNVDSVVTDPPYGLSFMGKKWDYDVPTQELWEKVYQSIKQGGHLLSFFGSRTYHRGAIPIEDAGFEIRDQLMWLYGSGFPKSHNIGKAVDKLQGNEKPSTYKPNDKNAVYNKNYGGGVTDRTPSDNEWNGWGTALKPAHEPIVMARKSFKGTVADNVLEHGTGGINIDGCRVGINPDVDDKRLGGRGEWKTDKTAKNVYEGGYEGKNIASSEQGRFPANVMHDGSGVVKDIFPDTKPAGNKSAFTNKNLEYNATSYKLSNNKNPKIQGDIGGSTSRYFYCAKTSKKDRNDGNNHPTVKPTELMRYLCRLVTPKGGVVLDPFMGSGSTGKAALLEDFKFIGIEMEREYFDIACARLEDVQKNSQQNLFAHKQIGEGINDKSI